MTDLSASENGTFAENILHFARTLRRAGLPVGPGRVIEAIKAVECAGLERRDDFYWALHSVFVNRHDQWSLFDQAFHIFWRNPDILKKMMDMMLPTTYLDKTAGSEEEIAKRLSQALAPSKAPDDREDDRGEEVEINASNYLHTGLTFSDSPKIRVGYQHHHNGDMINSLRLQLAW